MPQNGRCFVSCLYFLVEASDQEQEQWAHKMRSPVGMPLHAITQGTDVPRLLVEEQCDLAALEKGSHGKLSPWRFWGPKFGQVRVGGANEPTGFSRVFFVTAQLFKVSIMTASHKTLFLRLLSRLRCGLGF